MRRCVPRGPARQPAAMGGGADRGRAGVRHHGGPGIGRVARGDGRSVASASDGGGAELVGEEEPNSVPLLEAPSSGAPSGEPLPSELAAAGLPPCAVWAGEEDSPALPPPPLPLLSLLPFRDSA